VTVLGVPALYLVLAVLLTLHARVWKGGRGRIQALTLLHIAFCVVCSCRFPLGLINMVFSQAAGNGVPLTFHVYATRHDFVLSVAPIFAILRVSDIPRVGS
jgi:hypothetical protein